MLKGVRKDLANIVSGQGLFFSDGGCRSEDCLKEKEWKTFRRMVVFSRLVSQSC